jgi:hypothetical protein
MLMNFRRLKFLGVAAITAILAVLPAGAQPSPTTIPTTNFVGDVTVGPTQNGVGGTLWALGNFTVTGAATFNTPITSSSISPNLIQLATVTLTPTQIKAMYATPVSVLAAPGTGKSIVLVDCLTRFNYTDAYTSGGAIDLQYGNTAHGAGTTALSTLAASVLLASASADTILYAAGTTTTASQNTAIYVSNATGAFATGATSTLTLYIWYMIQ